KKHYHQMTSQSNKDPTPRLKSAEVLKAMWAGQKRVLTWCADRPLDQFHIETFKISSCLRKATVVNAAGLAKASHIGSWDMWTVLPGSWLPKLPNRWARALALL